jgi:hypothetical protein
MSGRGAGNISGMRLGVEAIASPGEVLTAEIRQ